MTVTSDPVLERAYRFEGGACEIHVVHQITSQGEELFRAAAYSTGDGTHELRNVTDDAGVPYEVLDSSPSTAAERLAEKLQVRYGRRLSGPEEISRPDAADSTIPAAKRIDS
jgi:hypothetical protein